MFLASANQDGLQRSQTGPSKLQDSMEKIADMIRNDPSIRQTFVNITTQRDPFLGQQLSQSLQLLDTAPSGAATLVQNDKDAIKRLTDRGFEKKHALASYLAANKNEELAANNLAKDAAKRVDPKARDFEVSIKAPGIGRFIIANPQLKEGLNEFIAQNDPDLARQAKEKPALFNAALQSVSFGGDESIDELSVIDSERRVVETLPLSARTSQNTNSPSFHVMKLPVPVQNITQLRHLVVEFCIQPLGTAMRQAIWWTSYVIIARRGTFTRGSGVYTEWSEFGKVVSHPPTGIIAPRTSDIRIVDISKGVLNGNQTNGTILRTVNLENMNIDVDIFALLVASGMHDGAYQAHGQATLEYRN